MNPSLDTLVTIHTVVAVEQTDLITGGAIPPWTRPEIFPELYWHLN